MEFEFTCGIKAKASEIPKRTEKIKAIVDAFIKFPFHGNCLLSIHSVFQFLALSNLLNETRKNPHTLDLNTFR